MKAPRQHECYFFLMNLSKCMRTAKRNLQKIARRTSQPVGSRDADLPVQLRRQRRDRPLHRLVI